MTNVTAIFIEDIVSKLALDLDLDSPDVKYLRTRFKNEGVAFLTNTLPILEKCVLRGLENGRFPRHEITHFRWKGGSLNFLSSFLSKVFDREGYVLAPSMESAHAIRVIRQLCSYLYKLATSFSKLDLDKAVENYIQKEKELSIGSTESQRKWQEQLRRSFETNYPELCRVTTADIFGNHRPRYTSGSVAASKQLPVPYWVWKQLPDSVTGTIPKEWQAYSGHFKPYPSLKRYTHTVDDPIGRVCEVLFVPKDSRGPRVISKENSLRITAQMSYFDFFSNYLENKTRGRVNFKNQEVNQILAEQGSKNGLWATLDLKEASDSVRACLVRHVLRNAPGLRWFINNARATHAILPNGRGTVELRKLAGMGSGLTFPTMAWLIFHSIATLVSLRTRSPYWVVGRRIYVYGDDVIIPTEWYALALEALQLVRLNVNSEKSFAHGFFRESCGADYYYGQPVTPVRVKLTGADLPGRASLEALRRSGKPLLLGDHGTLQLERHCRELMKNKLYNLASYYYKRIERGYGPLPYVTNDSPVMGRYSSSAYDNREMLAWQPVPVVEKRPEACPYKYLGKVLKDREVSLLDYLPSNRVTTFGDIAIPHRVRLVRKLEGPMTFYGIGQGT